MFLSGEGRFGDGIFVMIFAEEELAGGKFKVGIFTEGIFVD
jgi:hypothetical protein